MSVVETAKDIYELVKKGATIDVQQRLIQRREEAMTLQEENIALRQKLLKIEEQQRLRDELDFDGTIYWIKKPDGKKDGPFCQKCFDSKGLLIRLQNMHGRPGCHDWHGLEGKGDYGNYCPIEVRDGGYY